MFARAEWRTRWRSHLVVAALAAVTAAVFLSTFAAAARSRTAFDRLREATYASDLSLAITSGNPAASLEEVRDADGVLGARAVSDLFVRPVGSTFYPGFTVMGLAPRIDDPALVDVPLITAGRAPRPDRVDEVALSAGLAGDLGVEPGDEIRLESMTDEWVDASFAGADPGPPDGPTMTVTVTGIARSPVEFDRPGSLIHLTAAFVARFDGEVRRTDYIHARLDDEALERHDEQELLVLAGIHHRDSIAADIGAAEDGLETVTIALRLVGSVAGVAGALALALALARASRASAVDRSTLRSLGWTRADELLGLAAAHVPAIAGGLALGLTAGVLASPRATVHLARSIDPRPNSVLVDAELLLLLVGGTLAATALVVGAVFVVATRRPRAPSSRRRSRLRLGRPLIVWLGVRHALVAPAERGGRASRGAVAAVLGATAVGVAALLVSSSIGRLQDDASLTGERPERMIDNGSSIEAFDDVVARLAADERVDVIAGQHLGPGTLSGIGEVLLLMHEPVRGQADLAVTAGRMPVAADEVALGPVTAEAAGVRVGDDMEVSGEVGTARFRVVGTVLFPEGDLIYDEGVALTMDGGRRVYGDPAARGRIHQVFFDWADGVDADAADRELAADGVTVYRFGTGLRVRPGTVTNLGAVEQLPRQLALLVGLFAFATLLHAAWTGVVLRRRELVTLRALGVTRRATARLGAAHVIVIVVLGVLVGGPLGVLLGRATWRPIAREAHLVVRPVLSWGWTGLLVGATVVASLVVAALAGRWSGRLDPASALRAE